VIAPLGQLQDLVLGAGASGTASPAHFDSFISRVAGALSGLRKNQGDVGAADVAALLRQGILRCQVSGNEAPELRVPRGPAWPSEQMWKEFGCDVSPAGSHFLVRARRWAPTWLEPAATSVVDAALREEPRRRARTVPADPRLTEYSGLREYASPGQREAVRAAFLMPPGATTIVNLPTGAGKTLAFQLPALTTASDGGLTLVLVPTVALARDQEARFRALLARHPQGTAWTGMPLAYYGGLSTESKNEIKAGIREGTLPIVFASPEAVLGALRGPLFDAARGGRLRLFAIDEAHIVSQWGKQFRPEFQSVAGLRNALLDVCPLDGRFRTLLLTATLTPESHETLRLLFGQDDCQMVSEVMLRPEPGFLLHAADSETVRRRLVLEAIRHLPRPMILYTTLREDAEGWAVRLRDLGLRRVRLVRGGDLSDVEGEGVLRDWRSGAVDVVVATSAFGLGMDQAEVRSIVHACLPETIDRYYQEVGRAGRDGNAAVALLVSTPQDVQTAKALAEEKLISTDRGFERWEAMFVRGQLAADDTYVVSLNSRPADIATAGKRNASWNLRTLVLMARAGLLDFASHPPPEIERVAGEEEAAFESRRQRLVEQFFNEVAVRIKDNRHSREAHWNTRVGLTRTATREADRKGFSLVQELRDLRRPLNDIFREVYSLTNPPVRPPRFLGSCPVTRRDGTESFRSLDPETTTLSRTAAAISPELAAALSPCTDDAGRAWVSYDPAAGDARDARRVRERLLSLLRYSAANGVVELCLPDGLVRDDEWFQLNTRAVLRFLARTSLEDSHDLLAADMGLPRLTVLGAQDSNLEAASRVMRIHRPRHILVLPRELADPTRPDRKFFDVARHLSVEDLLARLGA
jgi:ATP-dependent DNA helicase RecQ